MEITGFETNTRNDGNKILTRAFHAFDLLYRAHHAAAPRLDRVRETRVERGRVGITRQHGDRERDRLRVPGRGRAVAQTFDAGAQHVDPTGRVEVEIGDSEPAEHARGPADRGGDVVQLQIAEDAQAQRR